MLDPIVNFFTRMFYWIGRGIGFAIGVLLWPFMWLGRWYWQRGWMLKSILGVIVAGIVGLYAYFIWNTQVWSGFNTDYVANYTFDNVSAGEQQSLAADGTRRCARSAIADVTADLVDFNVNENAWISSMILYKLGFFGIPWDNTPFLDNKASFQRGVHEAVRRTTTELADNLGRVRTTSQIDSNLQSARGNAQFDEYTWYFGFNPFGPKTPTPSYYRSIVKDLRTFNDRLERCEAVFDARADNLIQYLDRIASALGDTSAILRERSENYNNGWFDVRADDRFWFAFGQLYGYYGLLKAAQVDFEKVLAERNLNALWDTMEQQAHSALRIQPFIIANGREDGWITPTHLATMGFYILRVRSNLVEISNVLAR
ncbi:MAG: DUF2333 family protein [Rhizobiaceae bacterium]|nr:DUF2333 family protein [Rhizobiaceae bacterium]